MQTDIVKQGRPRGTDEAKVISVIRTKALRGAGIKNDPVRVVTQYWDFDGLLLAEHDPEQDNRLIRQVD